MKIEPIYTNEKEGYKFKINDAISLEISGTAISVLKITLPLSGNIEEFYKNVLEQFDIEKMVNDLRGKDEEITTISIDSEVCRIDDKIVFQTSDLEKYKK